VTQDGTTPPGHDDRFVLDTGEGLDVEFPTDAEQSPGTDAADEREGDAGRRRGRWRRSR
jgi:hypothetical protein